jgi:hypothetical protein
MIMTESTKPAEHNLFISVPEVIMVIVEGHLTTIRTVIRAFPAMEKWIRYPGLS